MKKLIFLSLLLTIFTGKMVSADQVTRLYNNGNGNHWFTTDTNKIALLVSNGWTDEGLAFEASGTELPAYVLTSPDGYYHFTANVEEIDGLVNKGWQLGEVVFYASSTGQPIYRLYNPNKGTHHFTGNTDEVNSLTNLGWSNEGVAYFVSAISASSQPSYQEITNTITLLKNILLSNNYFVDVSSHNGYISVDDFLSLKQKGITGVVVKLTEGTSYLNPYATSQVANAKLANMRVSVYHYSHYTTTKEAKDEAKYFVQAAKKMGLDSSTLMVDDIEEGGMAANINVNMKSWADEMNALGYKNLMYYTGQRWVDVNGGPISVSQFGAENFWLAHYPKSYEYMTQEEALLYSYHNKFAAWQYTSSSKKLNKPLDESIDYTGRFTNP